MKINNHIHAAMQGSRTRGEKMIKQYNAQKDTVLAAGVRQYFTLEPKAIREERRFNKWVDDAFKVFGFDKGRKENA